MKSVLILVIIILKTCIVCNCQLSPDLCNTYGMEALERNSYDSAIMMFDIAISIKPEYSAYYANKGKALCKKKEYKAALGVFDIAVLKDAKNCNAYEGRGMCYSFLNEFEKTLRDAEILKKLLCTSKYYYLKGHMFNSKQQYGDAIIELKQALSAEKNYEAALVEIFYSMNSLKDFSTLLSFSNQIIIDNPNSAIAFRNRGFAKSGLNDDIGAIHDFNNSISLNSWDAYTYNGRAVAYSNLGNYTASLNDVNVAIKLSPKTSDFYSNRSQFHIDNKNYREAITDGLTAIAMDKNKAWPYGKIAIAYDFLGEYNLALTNINIAIQMDPNESDFYTTKSAIDIDLGIYRQGIQDGLHAISLNNKDDIAYRNIGFCYLKLGDKNNGCFYFKKAFLNGYNKEDLQKMTDCDL